MADIYGSMGRVMVNIMNVISHLRDNALVAVKSDFLFKHSLQEMSKFLGTGQNETALFCCLFYGYISMNERPVGVTDLCDLLKMPPLRILEFREQIEALESLGFITSEAAVEHNAFARAYRIPECVIEAIIAGDEKQLKKRLRSKDPDLTYPEDITEKELFYPDEIRQDVASLFTYLDKDKFTAIRQRLVENKMGKGVCIMLHGDSGTGKTETVYQLARKTGRVVYHVDIGATISQWIGGTEQNLAAIFKKYARICEQAEKRGENIPILLFNEADALFGKRTQQASQAAEVQENHIQAMLLDSIEQQEGILIVTTNIPGFFDKAFERRFLFKIKFEKPDLEMKKKIWSSKARWLEGRSVDYLASSYALSGAEIDNVLRKATMREVLTGSRSSLKDLEDLCRKEKLEDGRKSTIGFGR